jgi:hypothetical protein
MDSEPPSLLALTIVLEMFVHQVARRLDRAGFTVRNARAPGLRLNDTAEISKHRRSTALLLLRWQNTRSIFLRHHFFAMRNISAYLEVPRNEFNFYYHLLHSNMNMRHFASTVDINCSMTLPMNDRLMEIVRGSFTQTATTGTLLFFEHCYDNVELDRHDVARVERALEEAFVSVPGFVENMNKGVEDPTFLPWLAGAIASLRLSHQECRDLITIVWLASCITQRLNVNHHTRRYVLDPNSIVFEKVFRTLARCSFTLTNCRTIVRTHEQAVIVSVQNSYYLNRNGLYYNPVREFHYMMHRFFDQLFNPQTHLLNHHAFVEMCV